jgi:hypothetical protein
LPRWGPLFSVLLFLAAIISAFWYLRNEEIERETESVKRDTEITQQQIGLRLIQNQEQLIRMARDLVTRDVDQAASPPGRRLHPRTARDHAPHLGRPAPPLKATHWPCCTCPSRGSPQRAGPSCRRKAATANPNRPSARAGNPPAGLFARLFRIGTGAPVFQLQVPLIERGAFAGTLVAEYSVESLLRTSCRPTWRSAT